MCDVCLLVFENANARADHLTSSGHLLQADTQPRSKDKDESNDCRLCLKHFKVEQSILNKDDTKFNLTFSKRPMKSLSNMKVAANTNRR